MANILGLIPARGGSKGIPNKNIIDLNGKPLINYTIEAALAASSLDHVVVSTDSQMIADIANTAGAETPFLRPEKLAADSSGAVEVIEHAVRFFKEKNSTIDLIVYLQPTSPLRTHQDIDAAIALMQGNSADSLVSVMDVPHQFGPDSLMIENTEGEAIWVENSAQTTQILSRQSKTAYVARNGPAILITRPETINSYGSLYGNKVLSYKMPTSRSIDIDEQADLEHAEWLLHKRKSVS